MSNRTIRLMPWITVVGLVLLSKNVEAQVSIKERVAIMPGVGTRGRISIMSSGNKFVVAPRNGTLRLLPDLIFKCQAITQPQIPNGHHLDITIRDTTYQVALDTGGFVYGSGDYFIKWDQCLGASVQFKYIQKNSLRPSFSRGVVAGDTIRFVYHAEFSNPTRSVTESYPTEPWYRWVDMWSLDPCVNDTIWMQEWLHLRVSYEDTVVTFTRLDSNNVFPTWVGHNNTTERNYMDLEVKATFRDSAIANTSIRLSKPILVDSGGHSHDGNRPTGRYRIKKVGQSGYDTLDTFARTTDSTGSSKFRFLASEFGGGERLRASLTSDSTRMDTVSLVTMVPGLVELTEGNHYVLTGAPNNNRNTNDPCRWPAPTSLHFRNHFGVASLVSHIQAIADGYDSLYHGIRLRINDMSLIFGGQFDYNNNWQPPHDEHRIGINADIDYTQGVGPSGNCVGLSERRLRSRINLYTRGRLLKHTDTPHYHLREY